VEAKIVRADQDDRFFLIAQQSVEGGQLVIQPPTEETHPEDQGRFDRQEAFFKIRRLLFGDADLPVRWDPCKYVGVGGIQITDHKFGQLPYFYRIFDPTIGCDQAGREGQCFGKNPSFNLAGAQKSYIFQELHNTCLTAMIDTRNGN